MEELEDEDLFDGIEEEEKEDEELKEQDPEQSPAVRESPQFEHELEESEYEPQDCADEEGAAEAAAYPDEPRKPMQHLPPEVQDRVAECLRYELTSIESQIAHAAEISIKDPFFERWKVILETKRLRCLEALEKLDNEKPAETAV